MSYLAVRQKILSPQHFGALPKRSALDLVACATHDIELALRKGKEASMLIMDVQGAFDAVLPNRLVKRLREQGWPTQLVRWVRHFVTGRRARVRIESTTTDEKELVYGVPQGSPASPILYMLYLAPLLQRRAPETRFAYADDVSFLRISNSTQDTIRALEEDLADALAWGKENAITFAPDKYELLHFSRKRSQGVGSVRVEDLEILPATDPVRWLGVYLDTKLNFKHHVEVWGAKGGKVAQHLRALNRVTKGMPPAVAVKAAKACVIPVTTYGAEVWYEGLTKPSRKRHTNEEAKLAQTKHVGIIDRVLRVAARAVLPVWRTTPVPILHYESGIPPARVLLQQIRKRASLRLRLLDEHHPLATRVQPGTDAQGSRKKKRGRPFLDQEAQWRVTRVQRMAQLTEECERPALILPTYRDGHAKVLQGKEAGVKEFKEKLQADPPGTVQIYSDGSGLDSRTAWFFVVYQNKTRIYTSTGTLSKAEVFDAEIRGATEGLQWVKANMDRLKASRIALCIDNTLVIQGIDGSTPASS